MIRFMMLVKDKMNPSILRLDYKRLWYQKKHLERVCVLFLTVVPPHSWSIAIQPEADVAGASPASGWRLERVEWMDTVFPILRRRCGLSNETLPLCSPFKVLSTLLFILHPLAIGLCSIMLREHVSSSSCAACNSPACLHHLLSTVLTQCETFFRWRLECHKRIGMRFSFSSCCPLEFSAPLLLKPGWVAVVALFVDVLLVEQEVLSCS